MRLQRRSNIPTYQPGSGFLCITVNDVTEDETTPEELETMSKSTDLTQDIRDLIVRYSAKLAKEDIGSEEYKASAAIIKDLGSVLERYDDNKSKSQTSLFQSLTDDLLGVLSKYPSGVIESLASSLILGSISFKEIC